MTQQGNTMITDLLLDLARDRLSQREVEDIVVGLGYIGVQLENGNCGLAATLREDVEGCCTLLEDAGNLTDRSPMALAKLIQSTNTLEAGIGLATVNAELNRDTKSNCSSPIQALQITAGDRVGMVG